MSDTRDDIVAVVHGYGGNEHANPDYVMAEEIVRLRAALAARTREVEEIRAALTTINALHNLGDAIYDVRERECQGWDGPNVTAYGEAHKVVQAFLNRALAAQEGTR